VYTQQVGGLTPSTFVHTGHVIALVMRLTFETGAADCSRVLTTSSGDVTSAVTTAPIEAETSLCHGLSLSTGTAMASERCDLNTSPHV